VLVIYTLADLYMLGLTGDNLTTFKMIRKVTRSNQSIQVNSVDTVICMQIYGTVGSIMQQVGFQSVRKFS
jgi:hypothetical protein